MTAELWFVFGMLTLYVCIPSRLKKIFWFNLGILLPLIGWMIYSQLTSGYSLVELGVRIDNPLAGALPAGSFFIVAFGCMLMIAVRNNRLQWNRNMAKMLVLYPLLGCAEQFIILSFLNVRLEALGWPGWIIATVTATAFMMIHFPDKWLMPATFVLGFASSWMFQYEPNIFTLGTNLGWLAIFYYNWVIGKDPFAEKFGPKPKGDDML